MASTKASRSFVGVGLLRVASNVFESLSDNLQLGVPVCGVANYALIGHCFSKSLGYVRVPWLYKTDLMFGVFPSLGEEITS